MIEAVIAAVGVAVSAFGMFGASEANEQQAQAQREALALQKQEQAERRKAMDLDARRRRREAIRQGISARALALATTTAQGGQFGSALPGAYGGIEGRVGTNVQGVNQNQEIGGNIFTLKGQISDAYGQAAIAGSRASTYSAVSQFGTSLTANSSNLAKIGSTAAAFLSQ